MKKNLLTVMISMLIIFSFARAQNVGIGTPSPTLARLQVNGSVGAAVAMFGADKYGVTIEADNPEIGFNYFFNGGAKTIKTGYASVSGMNPLTGEFYIGNFNGNQSNADFGPISGFRQNLTLYQNGEFRIGGSTNFSHFYYGANEDTYIRGGKNNANVIINDISGGRVGIGMSTPSRAGLEQNGVVGNTAAIFGGEGTGVSFQRDWPAIGLNHWYDGSTHRAIGIGYGAQIAVDQTIGASGGAIIFTNFSPRVNAVNGPLLNPVSNVFIQNGRLGVGTNLPGSEINIVHADPGFGSTGLDYGLRIEYPGTSYFNIYHTGGSLGFANNGNFRASISATTGAYFNVSDRSLKKNVHYLADEQIISKIILLKPVSYNMMAEEDSSARSYGFIAQDVQELFPDFVTSVGNIKAMCYQYFIPVLTKGIQEQQLQIEKLQTENTDLKARLERLEKILLNK
ncbi:MAG: tail fiber domain-containing protein [Chitinophagaceae bacterium]|nr:tail fiber domain-containing protein [Chitinophagaceae bacterium]